MKTKRETLKKIFKYWFPVIVWAIVIFSFSSIPVSQTSEIYWQDFIIKKTAHIIEYAIFSGLFYRALINGGVKNSEAGYTAIILSLLYGASDEFHQSFTPGREPTIRDVFFDTIGSVLAIYIIWNLLPKKSKKLKNWAKRLEII